MKRMKKWLISALSCVMVLFTGLGIALTNETVLPVDAAEYVTGDYVPTKADTLDYYKVASEVEGGGVSTFAHTGWSMPLDASYIKVETSFKLYSKDTTENGGDGVDGWVTYSFTSAAATADSQVPNGGNLGATGYYFQISNISSNSAPNCAAVTLYCLNGGTATEVEDIHLNDSVNERITIRLVKTADNTYTLSFRNENGATLTFTEADDTQKNPTILSSIDVTMTESLFANANGQTYLSTAIYENCSESDHSAHRGVTVYSVRSYEIAHPLAMSGYEYIPSTTDLKDCYSVAQGVTGGGVLMRANAGLNVPLDGSYISMDTQIKLLSKKATTEGGDGVDGWLSYSFTSAPITADSEIPYAVSNVKGIFFHIANVSGTSTPNCAEISLYYNDGTGNVGLGTVYVDNALDVPINFTLKANPDKTFTWSITKLSDGTVLRSPLNLPLNADLFINDDGQTYFSSYLYGSQINDSLDYRGVTITKVRTMDYGEPCSTNYTPVMSDMTDMFNTVITYQGDLSFTGNAALKSPINGYNIAVKSEFGLRSSKATADGGEGLDGWVTYSFSKTAPTTDSEIPYYSGSAATGIYFQLKNVSNVSNGVTTLNCADLIVSKVENGAVTTLYSGSLFIDNICNQPFTLSLRRMSKDVYTISFANETAVVKTYANVPLPEDLFVNEHGQTYLSTAIWVANADATRADRMVKLYAVNELPLCENEDIEVHLQGASYAYVPGVTYDPLEEVLAGDTVLTNGVDYKVTYLDNNVPGTATVRIDFIGDYYGVDRCETYFEIKEPSPSDVKLAALVEAVQSSFTMDMGAAVKMSSPTGLRFGAKISLTALENLKAYVGESNVTLGTVILPFDSLSAGELPRVDSGKTQLNIVNTNISDEGEFYAAVWNMSETNYTRQFSARSYVSYVYGEATYYIYATMDDNTRSVNYVAQRALLDTTKTYKDIHKERLENFVSVGQNYYYDDNSNDIQYIVYMITNKNADEIEPFIQRMVAVHGTQTDTNVTNKRMYAFGIPGPFSLSQSVQEMQTVVNKCFDLAEKYNVPVFFQVDDMTNYINFGSWAEGQFGTGSSVKFYEHPEMCEWVAFPEEGEEYGGQNKYGRLPRWYFDWGTEQSTTACPNLASPEFREFLRSQLQEGFLKPLIANMKELKTAGKGYLFAGCNIGWETQIPDYSADSLLSADLTTLEDWERTEYGYGALTSLGYTQASLEAEASANGVSVDEQRKTILYGVIQDFIEFVSKLVYDAGVPRHLIYTHTIASGSVDQAYDTMMPPLWVAINDYSTPGYTMANGNWSQSVLQSTIASYAPGLSEYIIAEGYKDGYTTEANAKAYLEAQFGGNCRTITVFGYDEENTSSTTADGFETAVNKWLTKSLLPNYTWDGRTKF